MTATNGTNSSARVSRCPAGSPATTVGATKCARQVERASAGDDLPVAPGLLDGRGEPLHGALVDHRPDEHVAVGRIADRQSRPPARPAARRARRGPPARRTITREQALHFWPEKPYADAAMPAAAASRSADAVATIVGFLPPISVIAGRAYAALLEASRPSARPTSAEPVKTTPSIAPSASALAGRARRPCTS